MSTHLERDLAHIKRDVLAMGALVEETLGQAIASVTERDPHLARAAREADARIDGFELELDEQCLKALALHQPVAVDLRFLTAVMKITTALERIGDLAGNIASRASDLARTLPAGGRPGPRLDLEAMAGQARGMLRDVLDAFVRGDSALAREVCGRDDVVDDHNRTNIDRLQQHMIAHPEDVPLCVSLLTVSRAIERTADHATNIAEDVVFLVEAVDIRHPGHA